MADKKTLNENIDAMFKGLENFLNTKTVVGEPVKVGDSTMIPLADVSFGLGAGAFDSEKKNNGAGGIGAKMSPTAVLMIAADGTTKLISLKSQDAIAKIIDMAPDIMTKFTNRKSSGSDTADGEETK